MANERIGPALWLGVLCLGCQPAPASIDAAIDGTQPLDGGGLPTVDASSARDAAVIDASPGPDAAVIDASAGPDGDDAYSIPRDMWARLDVLSNDGPIALGTAVRVVEAPTRGVVVVEADGRCRYRSDWHVDGADRFTYAVIAGGVEHARHRVNIEVRDELWLAVGGRPYRAHLDVGGAPMELDAPDAWETVLHDVADDGSWLVGERRRDGRWRGFWTGAGDATELAVGEQATYARRILGADVLGATLEGASIQGVRASRDGTVVERWVAPGAEATWPLGALDGAMLARIDGPTGSHGAWLTRGPSGDVVAEPLDLAGGAPTAIAGGRIGGVREHEGRVIGVVRDGAGPLVDVDLADATEVRVEDVDTSGRVVGRLARGTPFESSFVREADGTIHELALRTTLETSARGLSARGDIVGAVRDVAGLRRSVWLEPVTDPEVAALELTPVDEPPHPGIDHACFHADFGPFESVDASGSAELAAAVPLRSGHVTYTVTLVGPRSYIAIDSLRPAEEIAIFLETRSTVVRPLDLEGRNLPLGLAERTDTCEQLGFLVQVRSPSSGPMVLVIESAEPTMTFVLERAWVYR